MISALYRYIFIERERERDICRYIARDRGMERIYNFILHTGIVQ